MNIHFTIEEENIIAIYAENSRERTMDNINSAMPYMDEDMRQLAAAAVNKLQAMTPITKRGRGCRLPAPRPRSFLLFRGTLERHFLRFEYKVSSMPFLRSESRRNTGIFSP